MKRYHIEDTGLFTAEGCKIFSVWETFKGSPTYLVGYEDADGNDVDDDFVNSLKINKNAPQ